MWISDKAHV